MNAVEVLYLQRERAALVARLDVLDSRESLLRRRAQQLSTPGNDAGPALPGVARTANGVSQPSGRDGVDNFPRT